MADTAEIAVKLKDPSGKDVTVNLRNIPLDVFNSSNFENELKLKVEKIRPNHTITNWSATSTSTGKTITPKPATAPTTKSDTEFGGDAKPSKPTTKSDTEFGGDAKPSKPTTKSDTEFGGDAKPGTSTAGKPTTPQTTGNTGGDSEFGGDAKSSKNTVGSGGDSEFGTARKPGTSTAGKPTTPQTTGNTGGDSEFGGDAKSDSVNKFGGKSNSGASTQGGTGQFPNGRPGSQPYNRAQGNGTGTGTGAGTGAGTGTGTGTGTGAGGQGTLPSGSFCKPLTKRIKSYEDFIALFTTDDWARIYTNYIDQKYKTSDIQDKNVMLKGYMTTGLGSVGFRRMYQSWPGVNQWMTLRLKDSGSYTDFNELYYYLCQFNVDARSSWLLNVDAESVGKITTQLVAAASDSNWKEFNRIVLSVKNSGEWQMLKDNWRKEVKKTSIDLNPNLVSFIKSLEDNVDSQGRILSGLKTTTLKNSIQSHLRSIGSSDKVVSVSRDDPTTWGDEKNETFESEEQYKKYIGTLLQVDMKKKYPGLYDFVFKVLDSTDPEDARVKRSVQSSLKVFTANVDNEFRTSKSIDKNKINEYFYGFVDVVSRLMTGNKK